MAVNVTYSSTGQIASIQRGTTSEKVDYDGQGRIVSRVFADGKTWSYTYLEKVCLNIEDEHRAAMVGVFQESLQSVAGAGQGHMFELWLVFSVSTCKSHRSGSDESLH